MDVNIQLNSETGRELNEIETEEKQNIVGDDGQDDTYMNLLQRMTSLNTVFKEIPNPVSLCWKNITYEVEDKSVKAKAKDNENENENKNENEAKPTKVILNNISGYVRGGQVLVILGPSGSGKTTLLQVLSGIREVSSGDVYYQGRNKTTTQLSSDIMGFAGNAAYILQEDFLHGSLTVRENLRFAAELKIADPNIDKEMVSNKILGYLGLESCADAIVGDLFHKGISGGQKRRVSIGLELMSQPGLLFLDEITSGLDATTTYQLMFITQRLAALGHTIIMTLHQPSSRIYQLMCEKNFNMLILERGRCMYFGAASNLIPHFENQCNFPLPASTNPCDFVLDLVNSDFQLTSDQTDRIHAIFNDTLNANIEQEIDQINQQTKDNRLEQVPTISTIRQIWILLRRNAINHFRNPAVFWVRIAMYSMLCVCLGSLYWNIGTATKHIQDRISILFFVAAFLTFMSISGMPAFVIERSIYMKERMNNHYNTFAYCVANFLSSAPWIFIIALICSALIYAMIQSRVDDAGYHFSIYLANLFIALMVAESMMTAISALSSIFMVGLAMGAGLLGLYMIVCGFFILPSNIPAGWLWVHHAISFHTYSFRVFMYNEFHDFSKGDIDGNAVLKTYEMENTDLGFCFGILIVMMVVYRILFFVLLLFFNRRQK